MLANTNLRTLLNDAAAELAENGHAFAGFGNLSGIDQEAGHIVIKASGRSLSDLDQDAFVSVTRAGEPVRRDARPSRDLPMHIAVYDAFEDVRAIAHSHSKHATAWAQSLQPIPRLGTTHADYFQGAIKNTGLLPPTAVSLDFERNTGRAIVAAVGDDDPLACPGILIGGHGPLAWGRTPMEAAHNLIVLEFVAELALNTLSLNPETEPLPHYIADLHHEREQALRRHLRRKQIITSD